ncbi:MAG: hypothetical protein GF387_02670, partial [Candidatus Portnoybacteria bacterium]|nr:hypothetical protein [Candidatus Portnoybacteria bacterium]
MKKFLVILIILILIGFAVWFLIKDREILEERNNPEDILMNLENDVDLNFSEIKEAEIEWTVRKEGGDLETITISGKEFKAEDVSMQYSSEINTFFGKKGFVKDVYNIAAGTVGNLTGYIKENMICIVITTLNTDDSGNILKDGKGEIIVKCGASEEDINHQFTKNELIKKLFAEKYNKKMSEISLSIEEEAENHVRGSIRFESNSGAGGIFLAAKVNGEWRLVFDGNGAIPCEELERYNFPEKMKEDCAESQTIEAKEGGDFSIILNSNPSTGYQWNIDFDEEHIELLNRTYTSNANEGLVGSGGVEVFSFLAKKSGEARIVFSYLRSWEKDKDPLQEKTYIINIRSNEVTG